MIRFRHRQDEQRYLDLRTEIYVRIARSLPPTIVSEVMRNFGKLEQLLQLEGVRQGLAVAALIQISGEDFSDLYPLDAFARVYGSHDTPLTEVERGWYDDESFRGHKWLDAGPLEYAPQTLAEWQKEQAGHIMSEDTPATIAAPMVEQELLTAALDEDDGDNEALGRLLQESAQFMGRKESVDAQERPDMLDRLRTHIQGMQEGGWKPENWQQLIMGLHLSMQTDAAFLDIQLSTPMGQAVLAQCGIHLSPGIGVYLEDYK